MAHNVTRGSLTLPSPGLEDRSPRAGIANIRKKSKRKMTAPASRHWPDETAAAINGPPDALSRGGTVVIDKCLTRARSGETAQAQRDGGLAAPKRACVFAALSNNKDEELDSAIAQPW